MKKVPKRLFSKNKGMKYYPVIYIYTYKGVTIPPFIRMTIIDSPRISHDTSQAGHPVIGLFFWCLFSGR